jgi:hypothetical protein
MPVGIPSVGGAGEREPGSHESHSVSLDELDDAIVDLRNLRDFLHGRAFHILPVDEVD